MSGGSYNYLCHADEETIFQKKSELRDMADRLEGLGYANDVARETREVLKVLERYEAGMSESLHRLAGVWRAVEWWDSCDSDEGSVKKALEEYRGIG